MSAPETTTPREGDLGDANFDADHQHTTGSTNSTGCGRGGEGVYARAYPLYDKQGWPNSLKLPRGAKWPPPKGFTGKDGATPSAEEKAQWAREEPDGNIAQRLPETYIGIDVDHYGAKRGGDTLTEAERRWGPLPPTYVSTSRPDGVSGIRIYRIPEGVKLNGNITFPDLGLGDIEIIQYHHRYMACWPSIHPDTRNRYGWYEPGYSPEHIVEANEPPHLSTVAELTGAWLDGLQEKAKSSKSKGGSATKDSWAEIPYIIDQCLTEGEMSDKMVRRLCGATAACFGPSRHDSVRDDVLALLRYGKRGESGVFQAMTVLGLAFVNAVTADGSRTERQAEAEFLRMLSNKGAAERLSEPDDHSSEQGREATPTGRCIRLNSINSVVDDKPEWVWKYGDHGAIQLGTLSLLAGRPAAGKSTCARWFAAQSSRGELGGYWHGRPQNVAYIAPAEESMRYVIKPGLRAAGADMERIFYPEVTTDDKVVALQSARDEEDLARLLIDHNITVVIVDPVMSTFGTGADIHRNNEVRAFLEPWARIAEQIDGVVIGVVHLRKAPGGDVVAAINASSAFGEVARSVFGLAKDPHTGERVMSQSKNSTGREDLSLSYSIESTPVTTGTGKVAEVGKFAILGYSERTVSDLLSGPRVQHGPSAVDQAKEWLEDYLTKHGRTKSAKVKEAAREDGHSDSAIKRASNELEVVVSGEGFPRVSFWELLPANDDEDEQRTPVEDEDLSAQPEMPVGSSVGSTNTGEPTEPTGAHWTKTPSRAKTTYDLTETISKPESAGPQSAQSDQVGSSNFVGPTGELTGGAAEPRPPESPAPPQRQWREDQNDACRPTPPESDRADVGHFDMLRDKLLDKFIGSTQQTSNGNGERGDPALETETNPVPPGGLTDSTPGVTDRVRAALARARTRTASTVTNRQATGADSTVERDLAGPKQEGLKNG